MLASGVALGSALPADEACAASASRDLRAVHKRVGGRLGVHVLDSQSGRRLALDDGSRYAMASTFKLPLAAALLWQVDRGAFPLTHELPVAAKDVLSHSPMVEKRVAEGDTGMSVRDLCTAAMIFGDNAAANVLLAGIGGPAMLTQFVRSIGDGVTRFDRTEPEINGNQPGDERDTTTPRAMVEFMLKIFTQNVLTLPSRAMLIDWMVAARTGLDRTRAGLPKSWQSGDRTGSGDNGAFNDLVITWPPERRPVLIAVYMSDSKLPATQLAAAQAQIGAIIGREKWP